MYLSFFDYNDFKVTGGALCDILGLGKGNGYGTKKRTELSDEKKENQPGTLSGNHELYLYCDCQHFVGICPGIMRRHAHQGDWKLDGTEALQRTGNTRQPVCI